MPAGRPKKPVDLELVAKLSRIQCTVEEIASCLNVSASKLHHDEQFLQVYEKGRDEGRKALRRLQFEAAMGEEPRPLLDDNGKVMLDQKDRPVFTGGRPPNIVMQIWLGKQWLKQTDRMETDVTTKGERINQQTIRLTPGILSRSIAVLRDAGAIRPVSQPVVSDN